MTILPPVIARSQRTAVEREAAAYRREVRFSLSHSLGLLVTLMAFVVGSRAITDNSLLTHLATGDLILDRRWVPTTDPYSWTASDGDWTVQSWLASVLYASLDRLFGTSGVRAVHGLVAGAIGLSVWQLVRPARQVVPRLALALIPIFLGAGLWSPRPLMFGLLAMTLVLQVLQLHRPIWWLLPIMWLWVNSHGSFPLGVALVCAVAFGAWLDGRDTTRERSVVLWCIGGTLLGAVNPLGPSLLLFPLRLLGRREALEKVVEWQAPSFDSAAQWSFLLVIPLIAVAAKRGAQWRSLVPAICFAAGGFLAVRNLAVATIVVVALLAPAFGDFYGTDNGSSVSLISRVLGRGAVASFGLILAIVLIRPGLDLSLYPTDEVDYLEERGLVSTVGVSAGGVGLIHREAVGNYLTYRYGSDASVFIDDRFDFYPLDVTRDHLTLLDGGDFAEVLDRREADVVLWSADETLSRWLDETDDWEIAVKNDDWIVACRTASTVYFRCRS